MAKGMKRITVLLALALFVMIYASFTALAAEEKRFDFKNGYVTISNIVDVKKIEDHGYGDTMYIATAPATVTFHGELSKETEIAKWIDDEGLDLVEIKDNVAVLTDTDAMYGYGVFPVFAGETQNRENSIVLQVVAGTTEAKQPNTAPASKSEPLLAAPAAAKVLVNGKNVSFDAYNIDGNNYFKLRDLAMSVNGSEKNFEVSWDNAKSAITLTSNKTYTPEGNELVISGKQTSKQVTETTANVYLDDKEVKFIAYNIDGNNYFKLRDVAKMMNIGVTWDANANSVGIDTKAVYKE